MPSRSFPGLFMMLVSSVICILAPSTGRASSAFGLPEDPQGVEVIDRELVWQRIGDWDALYAILYSSGGGGCVEVHGCLLGEEGADWVKLHTWRIEFEGNPVRVPDNAVLEAWVPEDGMARFSFVDDLFRFEGLVTLQLVYDPGTGLFEEIWAD